MEGVEVGGEDAGGLEGHFYSFLSFFLQCLWLVGWLVGLSVWFIVRGELGKEGASNGGIGVDIDMVLITVV